MDEPIVLLRAIRGLGSAHGDDIAQAGPANPLPRPIVEPGDVNAVQLSLGNRFAKQSAMPFAANQRRKRRAQIGQTDWRQG